MPTCTYEVSAINKQTTTTKQKFSLRYTYNRVFCRSSTQYTYAQPIHELCDGQRYVNVLVFFFIEFVGNSLAQSNMSVGGVWEVWKYRRTVYKQAIFIEGYTNCRYCSTNPTTKKNFQQGQKSKQEGVDDYFKETRIQTLGLYIALK